MKLYFLNDSKQKRLLDENNYVEDIYDMVEVFFEEHRFKPHFVQTQFENGWEIVFGSFTEKFLVEDFTEENIEDAIHFLKASEKE